MWGIEHCWTVEKKTFGEKLFYENRPFTVYVFYVMLYLIGLFEFEHFFLFISNELEKKEDYENRF